MQRTSAKYNYKLAPSGKIYSEHTVYRGKSGATQWTPPLPKKEGMQLETLLNGPPDNQPTWMPLKATTANKTRSTRKKINKQTSTGKIDVKKPRRSKGGEKPLYMD